MTKYIINIKAIKQIATKVVEEYKNDILDKYSDGGDDGIFSVCLIDDIIESIEKNETYINHGFNYYGGQGSVMELCIAIIQDVILKIKKDKVVCINEKTYYSDDYNITPEQWKKNILSACPMIEENYEIHPYLPDWYSKYTIKPCFTTDIDKQIVLKALNLTKESIDEVVDGI